MTKLAGAASRGTIHGIDYAQESVDAARRNNRQLIERGQVTIQQASVTELPFADNTFDLVTAVETHFWWQDLDAGMREVFRVLKPGGRLLVVAEFYNGGKHAKYVDHLAEFTSMAILNIEEHHTMFSKSGFIDVRIVEDQTAGWICGVGVRP